MLMTVANDHVKEYANMDSTISRDEENCIYLGT